MTLALPRRALLAAGLGAPAAAAPAGFRMPAEWARHERTLMQFVPPQNWRGRQIEGARAEWAAVANAIADFEPVTMVIRPDDQAVAANLLSGAIERVEAPLNDGWARDSGPIVLRDAAGNRAVAGFRFNAWGGKFRPFADDARLKHTLAARFGWPIVESAMVLEGGAIAVDGQGTGLTTEQCLLNPNRNPSLDRAGIEAELRRVLGLERVVWLPRGIAPDPITDGHVDGLAAFTRPGEVLLCWTDDPADRNFRTVRAARRALDAARDARGRPFRVIPLPLTGPVLHMNFYLCNGAVIVPIAGDRRLDDAPLGVLREAFPRRQVVGVAGGVIAAGGGGVHCITQQVPEGA